jgi:hypothetical protein
VDPLPIDRIPKHRILVGRKHWSGGRTRKWIDLPLGRLIRENRGAAKAYGREGELQRTVHIWNQILPGLPILDSGPSVRPLPGPIRAGIPDKLQTGVGQVLR